ncbi:MAG: hypothetical protein CMP22_07220 [Rickettsiales bacterium]|nr:hypothetical protein [Rickettsiales bacterium]
MIDILDLVNKYGFPLLFIGQIFLAGVVLYLKDKFASKEIEDELSTMDDRLKKVEFKVDQIPTKNDFHQLEMKITDLQGDLKRVDQNLVGIERLHTLVQNQTNRIEDFLKRSTK